MRSILGSGLVLSALTFVHALFVAVIFSAIDIGMYPGLIPQVHPRFWGGVSVGLFVVVLMLLLGTRLKWFRDNPYPLLVMYMITGTVAGLVIYSRWPELALTFRS